MSRRPPATPEPATHPAFWRTGSFRFACVFVTVGMLVLLTWWLQSQNVLVQHERKLREHPRLSRLAAQWTSEIGRPPPRTGAARSVPMAVWFGKVSQYKSAEDATILQLDEAILVAGTRTKNDTPTQARILVSQSDFRRPPAPGELWLVSVTRSEAGGNLLYAAERAN